jgi:hypothetical protein
MANIERKGQDILSQVAIMTEPLIKHLRELIENTRKRVASVVSDETTQLYWNVGYAINTFVLQGNRAEYGKQIVATVSRQLAQEFGSGFEEKNVRRMMQFATEYQDFEIVATLMRQLPWSHYTRRTTHGEPLGLSPCRSSGFA